MSKENKQIRLTDNEYRLMEVIWDTEPVLATKLVEICLEKCSASFQGSEPFFSMY